MSRYSLFVEQHKDCRLCPLHETRRRTVIARGSIPCDVLFVGEAPGFSEDASGLPFVGPAGKLLDEIVKRAFVGVLVKPPVMLGGAGPHLPTENLRLAFTNLVMCIPLDGDRNKTAEPDEDHINACKPRLEQFIELCGPKLVVAVGRLAEDHLKQGYKYSIKLPRRDLPMLPIVHPAAILRYPVAQRDMAIQRTIVQLRCVVQKLEV